jgi:hypothetical protein
VGWHSESAQVTPTIPRGRSLPTDMLLIIWAKGGSRGTDSAHGTARPRIRRVHPDGCVFHASPATRAGWVTGSAGEAAHPFGIPLGSLVLTGAVREPAATRYATGDER